MKAVAVVSQGSAGRVCVLFAGYGLLHSLLASSWSKNLVERWGGKPVRHGLYRPFFIVQSAVTTLRALKKFWELSDRTLYRVLRLWSWFLRAVQAFAVALAAVGFAALAIFRDHLPPGSNRYMKRLLDPLLSKLRQLHSGRVCDYTAWLAAGMAVLGMLFLAALKG